MTRPRSREGALDPQHTIQYGTMVERLDVQDYFEVGLDLLAEGGLASVTIANLCERLGVTKGSFYHHFAGGPDFQQRLLTYWSEDRVHHLIEMVESTPDPLDRITLMKRMAVELHHEAESAIRAWARSDERGWSSTSRSCTSSTGRASPPWSGLSGEHAMSPPGSPSPVPARASARCS